jgi:hypothetical protein
MPPQLLATSPDPAPAELSVDTGIELIFDEPIDLDRAAAGGIQLQDAAGAPIPAVIESHGAAVVVRPKARLDYGTDYQVALSDVADVAGNKLAATAPVQFTTMKTVGSAVPMTIVAAHPGAPCALTGATAGSSGRCAGGAGTDDLYEPFALPANEPLDVTFSQPIREQNIIHGTQCGSGDVRVERLDGTGACVEAVPGTLMHRERTLVFIPDVPWQVGMPYKLTLVSGGGTGCSANGLCGFSDAASFDPLNGTTSGNAGGPDAVFVFTGAPATAATYLVTTTSPFTDLNGSGFVDASEISRDSNRVALAITGTSGSVSGAHFNNTDCQAPTPAADACIYLSGALPVEMQPVQQNCTLPDGSSAANCMPIAMSAEAMYGTSISMTATVVLDITNDTGTSVMRVRQPASGGPPMGYVVDRNGTPTLVASLDLYMDAPDLSLPLGAKHDLHSKPLTIGLEGPLTVLHDGRIAITTHNVADVPMTVNIDVPLAGAGSIDMVVPAGEMHLQLLSPPLRGGAP